MVNVSQKTLFAKIALFADEFVACVNVAQSILENTSCTTLLAQTEVENTLKSLDKIDLVVFVSRIIKPEEITHPLAAVVTNAQEFTDAVSSNKKIIYLSGHYLRIVEDSDEQLMQIAKEIEEFSYAVA